ncbi:MAG: efflux transporter outer membrane subunit [Myxococcota bacterium]
MAALALCPGLALACASAPEVRPPVEVPPTFSTEGAQPRARQWWEDLHDPALSRLVEDALADNLDLAVVWDRLAQARAIARREGAPLWPELDGDAGAGTTWYSDSATHVGRRVDDFRLGLMLSWELDIFGRLRATRDAARFDAEVSEAEVRAAAIALAGEVATQWYAFVEQTRQLGLLDEQIRTNEAVLTLVTMSFRAGQAGAADVLRQRQLVEQRRGERERVAAQAEVAVHALAVLLGRPPMELALPAAEALPVPGPVPETGLPSALLERRPDVRSAYLAVLATDRRLAAARADRYPRLSLSASAAYNASELADILDNWMAGLAASLVAPLFDAGRRQAEVERTRAALSERIHTYGQVILDSLQEVEDALVQERQQRRLIESLETQLTLARQTLARLRDRYVKGATDYLDVLAALSSQQELERSVVTARRELLDFRIALHRALAGGFPLETPALAMLDEEAGAPASANAEATP